MTRHGGWVAPLLLALGGCEITLAPSCSALGEAEVHHRQGGEAGGEAPEGGGASPETAAAACPGATRSGMTECFPDECGPGQFCDDRSGLADCRPGCTSDANCGSHDTCVRPPGAAIGRCESCGRVPRRVVEDCGGPDRSGVTPCFPGECAPGQYCTGRDISHCEPGCTSDENCAPTERCERPDGSALGICRACDFEPPA